MNKLDYYIEVKQKEKITLRVIELKKLNYSYEIIENELVSKKFPLKLVKKVMAEQGIIKRNIKKNIFKFNISDKVKIFSKRIKKEKPVLKIEEAKEESIGKPKPKMKIPFFKSHFDFRENKRIIIAIGMLFLFFIALGVFSYFNKAESGNGTCPLVSLDDVKKVNSLYIERNNKLSYIEYDQLVGAYFGKSDCNLINAQTVKKLRSIDLS